MTAVIAIGASILAGFIYLNIVHVNTILGIGEMFGNLIWVILITLVVVGAIANAIMTKLLPKKPK